MTLMNSELFDDYSPWLPFFGPAVYEAPLWPDVVHEQRAVILDEFFRYELKAHCYLVTLVTSSSNPTVSVTSRLPWCAVIELEPNPDCDVFVETSIQAVIRRVTELVAKSLDGNSIALVRRSIRAATLRPVGPIILQTEGGQFVTLTCEKWAAARDSSAMQSTPNVISKAKQGEQ
jgi:hypothetical protein